MRALSSIINRIENATGLDAPAKPLIDMVGKATKPRAVRNLASGTPLGHPLHPLLTDLPIGAWTSAVLVDLLGGEAGEAAADLLVRAGIVAAVPTAASGLNDWSDTYGQQTRVGLVHAAANTGALLAYLCSACARHRGHRGRGKALALLGLGAITAGGYLGGHLSFTKGVNVNRVAWEYGPDDWTPVLADADLADGEHRRVDAGGTPVLVHRAGGEIWAISATCSHMGGPLDEGEIADGCVTCPWHGSVFRLRDGGIERGPACVAQPAYQTRVNDGKIEVRAAS